MLRLVPIVPLLMAAQLAAQQAIVVPASAATTPANSAVAGHGTIGAEREQTLIHSSHLTGIVGQQITALSLRRDENNTDAAAGSLRLTVRLSTTPHDPLDARSQFQANHGSDLTTVFSGDVALPQVVNGSSNPGWTGSDAIRIPFNTPFPYAGGNLTVEISGQGTPGVTNDYWNFDAVLDAIEGSAVDIGPGCGSYAGNDGRWVLVDPESLVIGESPAVKAFGTPGGPALHVLSTLPFPNAAVLAWVDGQPCHAHVANWFFMEFAGFVPQPAPLSALGGVATTALQIPNNVNLMGASFASQWVDVNQGLATSNAVLCTIASQAPGLGMSQVHGPWNGGVEPTLGKVNTRRGNVLRFEVQ